MVEASGDDEENDEEDEDFAGKLLCGVGRFDVKEDVSFNDVGGVEELLLCWILFDVGVLFEVWG